MWREALYLKLRNLGFGGKTLSLIKSMYHNDNVRFLINGHYSDAIWLTKGVKQGKNFEHTNYRVGKDSFSGCNLSPLLFSIFIDSLGTELNLSKLGISLSDLNISALFFADDIVLVGKNTKNLDQLMTISRKFFFNHHLKISETKSKIMMYNAATGQTTFSGGQDYLEMTMQQVIVFKYLGVDICSSPRGLFRAYNERVKSKARQYLQSVLSLVRAGPDRSDLAYTLWTCCALPAILYGCEVVPLHQGTIQELESCQARVGKFILQVPNSSASVCTSIDSGFKPVWAVIAERVMLYAKKMMSRSSSYWPKQAFTYHIQLGWESPYVKYLNKWKDMTNSYGVTAQQIRKNVKHHAIKHVYDAQRAASTTAFPLSCPGTTPVNRWFRPKPWVSDSCFTKIFAEFRTCNSGLGNRGPTKDGRFFKLCPLCSVHDDPQLNNEV